MSMNKRTDDIYEILRQKDLFLLSVDSSKYRVLYAPLADSCILVDDNDINQLAAAVACPDQADEETLEILDALTDVVPISHREGIMKTEKDFINLSILPNNTCNFACSYCYSAKGRSGQQLKYEQAKDVIEFFLSPERNKSEKLTITFFGGGEPLISWDNVVMPSIDLINKIAQVQHRRVVITVITNGSVIPSGFLERCRDYAIDLVCSYEILEEIQNVQRKHYHLVTENIGKMIAQGVVPAINSVITELNVERQSEMIDVLHQRFPQIRYVAFEPVLGPNVENRRQFYTRYTEQFIKAKSLADQLGIRLTCSALRNVDVTVNRYCPGEFALVANGSLTICPCISSPQEDNFDKYVYGKVSAGQGVCIDNEKLSKLLAVDVDAYHWCDKCFARYNCGGGCMNTTISNNNQQDVDYCHFVRNFLKYMLLKRLDENYMEDSEGSIKDLIGNYEEFIKE